MTEQELKAQIMIAFDADKDEAKAKAALAGLLAHGLMSLQRIAAALEAKQIEPGKG